MELVPKDRLIQTGPFDHADWNYRPLLAFIARRRFALALSLLPPAPARRLLEVGFGSGVLMPELAKRCGELHGIDVHPSVDHVNACLAAQGVSAMLSRQDAAHTSFPDHFFDAIIAVSALEFIESIEDAASELSRILSREGRLITVMPRKSRLLDAALHLATGEDAERDYQGRREHVLPALLKHFRIARKKSFFPIYTAYELRLRIASG